MGVYEINNPCHHCKERAVGCHDSCPGYRKFLEDNEAFKKAVRREKRKDDYARRIWK